MRTLRAAAAAVALALAVMSGEARAETSRGDAEPAAVLPGANSFPEAIGVVAGAVLLQAAVLGMALLILFPNLRRRGAAMSSVMGPARPRR